MHKTYFETVIQIEIAPLAVSLPSIPGAPNPEAFLFHAGVDH